jgi:hypothetical protein
VTHGYHVEMMGILHGGEKTYPEYCSKAGIAFHKQDSGKGKSLLFDGCSEHVTEQKSAIIELVDQE